MIGDFSKCPLCGAGILPVGPAVGGMSHLKYPCGMELLVKLEVVDICKVKVPTAAVPDLRLMKGKPKGG